MSSINLSIAGLFETVFGYKTSAFEPNFAQVVDINDNNGGDGLARKEYGNIGSSRFYAKDAATGREYYLPVTIEYATGTPEAGDLAVTSIALPNPIIRVSCRKTIIKTGLTERRGTVKELVNVDDYVIHIKGFILSKYDEYPETVVARLRELFEVQASVAIRNPITDIFLLPRGGNDRVVIETLDFPEVVGVRNVRPYEMTLVSDEDFSLLEIE